MTPVNDKAVKNEDLRAVQRRIAERRKSLLLPRNTLAEKKQKTSLHNCIGVIDKQMHKLVQGQGKMKIDDQSVLNAPRCNENSNALLKYDQ